MTGEATASDPSTFALAEHKALREEIMKHTGELDRIVVRTVTLVASAYLIAFASRISLPGLGQFELRPTAGIVAALLPIGIVWVARRNFNALVLVAHDIGQYLTSIERHFYARTGEPPSPIGWETYLRGPETGSKAREIARQSFWRSLQWTTVAVSAVLALDMVIEAAPGLAAELTGGLTDRLSDGGFAASGS